MIRPARWWTCALWATLVASTPSLALAQRAPGDDPPGDDAPLDIGMPVDDPPPDADAPPPGADEPAAPTPDPRAAKKLAEGAAKFAKKGDQLARKKKAAEAAAEWERALAAYDKSFELDPLARTLVATAELAAKLARWPEVIDRYERALAIADAGALDGKARARVSAALEDAKTHVGLVVLTIQPEGAVVSLDGVDVGTAPLPRPLVLAPGQYALAIHADGYTPLTQKLVVDEGSESERTIELQPVPVVVRPPPAPAQEPEPPPPPPPGPSKLPLYAGAGVTAALAGGAILTGVLALGRHGTFTDPASTPEQVADAQSSGRTLAHVTDALIGGAVVAAGVTAYWYVAKYRPRAAERARGPNVVVVPAVERDGGGLVLTGRF